MAGESWTKSLSLTMCPPLTPEQHERVAAALKRAVAG